MLKRSKLILLLATVCMVWTASGRPSEETSGHVLGGALNSPIRIEVFSDFQCSACREFYLRTIRQILQEYSSKDKVCVIYHEYPLTTHRYSRSAAQYAEAAAQLGVQKLLSVMDSLFMDQAQWTQDGNLEASISKALSREDFLKLKKAMQNPAIDQAINKDIQLAITQKIISTPTMIISYTGKQQKVEGLVTYLVLKQFIDSITK
jgi:protein-disulfide isomerase